MWKPYIFFRFILLIKVRHRSISTERSEIDIPTSVRHPFGKKPEKVLSFSQKHHQRQHVC